MDCVFIQHDVPLTYLVFEQVMGFKSVYLQEIDVHHIFRYNTVLERLSEFNRVSIFINSVNFSIFNVWFFISRTSFFIFMVSFFTTFDWDCFRINLYFDHNIIKVLRLTFHICVTVKQYFGKYCSDFCTKSFNFLIFVKFIFINE